MDSVPLMQLREGVATDNEADLCMGVAVAQEHDRIKGVGSAAAVQFDGADREGGFRSQCLFKHGEPVVGFCQYRCALVGLDMAGHEKHAVQVPCLLCLMSDG